MRRWERAVSTVRAVRLERARIERIRAYAAVTARERTLVAADEERARLMVELKASTLQVGVRGLSGDGLARLAARLGAAREALEACERRRASLVRALGEARRAWATAAARSQRQQAASDAWRARLEAHRVRSDLLHEARGDEELGDVAAVARRGAGGGR